MTTIHIPPELGEGHPQTCLMDGLQAATGATYGKVMIAKTLYKGSFNKTKSSVCGEYVFDRYVRMKDGQPVCIPCSGYEKTVLIER